jgi:hypothetical protein
VAVVLTPERPKADAYLIATGHTQLLSKVRLTPAPEAPLQQPIIDYLNNSEEVDYFIDHLRKRMHTAAPRDDDARFRALYDELWSASLREGCLGQFFPKGLSNQNFCTLADAFPSDDALKRYAELSLVSALIDRYVLTRHELKSLLRCNPGQFQRVMESLPQFKNKKWIDVSGDEKAAFWFSVRI